MTTRLFIKNLAYSVDEAKLHEVFSMSGRVVKQLRRQDSRSKGQAIVKFAHSLEAIQAMVMFPNAKLLTRKMEITQDKVGPLPIIIGGNPDGLVDVRGGLA